MTAAELQLWWIFYQMQPWGEERADLRMGISTSSLINMWIAKGQKSKPSDFIPDFNKPHLMPKRQSAAAMLAVLREGTRVAGEIRRPVLS